MVFDDLGFCYLAGEQIRRRARAHQRSDVLILNASLAVSVAKWCALSHLTVPAVWIGIQYWMMGSLPIRITVGTVHDQTINKPFERNVQFVMFFVFNFFFAQSIFTLSVSSNIYFILTTPLSIRQHNNITKLRIRQNYYVIESNRWWSLALHVRNEIIVMHVIECIGRFATDMQSNLCSVD